VLKLAQLYELLNEPTGDAFDQTLPFPLQFQARRWAALPPLEIVQIHVSAAKSASRLLAASWPYNALLGEVQPLTPPEVRFEEVWHKRKVAGDG
jgi:hypothetical protein